MGATTDVNATTDYMTDDQLEAMAQEHAQNIAQENGQSLPQELPQSDSATIAPDANAPHKRLKVVPRTSLRAASWGNQRKRKRNPVKFAEIRADIAARGIDSPLQVRPHPTETGDVYELLAGYGRLEIAELENIELIPVVIHFNCDDTAAKLIMAAENLQREDLHPVDAAQAAASMLADLGGDMEALASVTNWNESRLNKYFQLLRCSESVKAIIDIKQDSGFTLTLGHANELSGLPEDMQDKVLKAVLDKKMTVKDLRSFAKANLEREISTAIFNTTECNGCKFNKIQQTDLFFEDTNTGAICTNIPCFKEKTDTHLTNRLEELKEEHGNVIFLSTVADNVTPVSSMVVGKEKFTSKCLSCTKYTALLVDEGEEIDTVKESYCLDLECAKKKDVQIKTSTTKDISEKPQKKKAAKKAKAPTTKGKVDKANAAEEKQPETTDEPVKAAVATKGVINDAKEFIRQQHAPKLAEHDTFSFALMLFAIRKLKGVFPIGNSDITDYMKEDAATLSEKVRDEISDIIFNTNPENSFNGQALAILAGSLVDNAIPEAKQAWKPTEEMLGSMQKSLRIQILEQSGFTKAFIERFDDKAYQKLLGMKRDDQAKTILAIDFDWSNYCPDYVTDLMK